MAISLNLDTGKRVENTGLAMNMVNITMLKPLKMVWVICITFIKFSSIHGFAHITTKGRHPIEKGLWTGAVCLAVFGIYSLGWSTWNRFQQNPTVVSMERNYQEWNTTFPTITLCPTEKFSNETLKRTLDEYEHIRDKLKLRNFLAGLSQTTFGEFHKIQNDFKELRPDQYWQALVKMTYPFEYKVSNSNPDIYGVTRMNMFVSELGICYSYHSDSTHYFTPAYWEQNQWSSLGKFPRFQSSPLDGDIFTQIRHINSAYQVYLTSPSELPDVTMQGLPGAQKTFAQIDLTVLSIVSSTATQRLSIQQRKCRLQHESNLITSPIYSYTLCRMECRMKASFELCGCVPYFYRPTGKYKVCDYDGMQCLDKYTDLLKRLVDPETGKKRDCKCFPLCEEVNYFIDASNDIPWPIGTNLKVGFVKYPRFRLKRDILFGQIDLLVSIGGTAGLFLGCSILSLVEIIYFFLIRLYLYFRRGMQLEFA